MVQNREVPTLPTARSLRFPFRGQFLHAAAVVVLGTVAWALAAPTLGDGSWLGVTDTAWFLANVGLAIVHQFYTWLAFRGQLGRGVFTRLFGRFDLAAHAALFAPLLVARPGLVAALFQHAFVWAHYLGTERPDMDLIYGD